MREAKPMEDILLFCTSPQDNGEVSSRGGGVAMRGRWRAVFHGLIVENGSGPEGSRPAANNHRSWGCGMEKSSGSLGIGGDGDLRHARHNSKV